MGSQDSLQIEALLDKLKIGLAAIKHTNKAASYTLSGLFHPIRKVVLGERIPKRVIGRINAIALHFLTL